MKNGHQAFVRIEPLTYADGIMVTVRRVRIIKKVQDTTGSWKFVSLVRTGNRYIWDSRPGFYFLDWRDGKKRLRELAGATPAEALEAQRRKRNELIGEA